MQCLGLMADKPTLQKTCRSEQNGFDCSGARTPDDRCTIGTMYHWAIQADKLREMMEYIPHVARYIPTHTYIYLCIHAHICIYLHIHAHTCTYPTPPSHQKSHKSVGGGRLWCTLQAKINIWFQHTQAGPVLCWREGDSAKFWRVQSIRADSMAVARQVPTPILDGKIEKSGRRGGLGWGQKVVGHMPWGALSGSPRVLGHEEVFWGCCGGFRAPVVQCMQ